MITDKKGDAAIPDIEKWANQIARSTDQGVKATGSYHDADSNTYVLRLEKGRRVLLFRLSEAQVHTPQRESECEKTLKTKINDLSS
jgi:hypothetical protein